MLNRRESSLRPPLCCLSPCSGRLAPHRSRGSPSAASLSSSRALKCSVCVKQTFLRHLRISVINGATLPKSTRRSRCYSLLSKTVGRYPVAPLLDPWMSYGSFNTCRISRCSSIMIHITANHRSYWGPSGPPPRRITTDTMILSGSRLLDWP